MIHASFSFSAALQDDASSQHGLLVRHVRLRRGDEGNKFLDAFLLPPLLQATMDLFRLVCCKDGLDLLGIGGTTSHQQCAQVLHDA